MKYGVWVIWTARVAVVLLLGCGTARTGEVFEPGKGWQPGIDQTPAPSDTPEGRYEQARVLFEAGKLKRCRDLCKETIARDERGDAVEQTYVLLVRTQAGLRELEDARKTVDTFRKKFPNSTYTGRMLAAEMDIAERKLAEGDKKTLQTLKELVDRSPYSPRADRAQLLIGHYYLQKRDYEEARHAYEVLLTAYPTSDHRLEAEFGRAKATYLANQGVMRDIRFYQESREIFGNVLEADRNFRGAEEAHKYIEEIDNKLAERTFRVGQYYEGQRRKIAASFYYRDVVRLYGQTPWAEKALERLKALGLAVQTEPAPGDTPPQTGTSAPGAADQNPDMKGQPVEN